MPGLLNGTTVPNGHTTSSPTKMLQLSPDPAFHYEMLRVLAATTTQGSDVSELLHICPTIIPGDFESWHDAFVKLAHIVLEGISDESKTYDDVTKRNVYLRASHYFFAADFYLHGKEEDPRIMEMYELWTGYFDRAMELMPYPVERLVVQTDGFGVPVVVLRPDGSAVKRPTLVLGNGFDGSLEEMVHVLGFPALERGYNVVLYEGPGQTGVRRTQGVGFIHDWERVLSPVVDYLEELEYVDVKRISLVGYSLGGYLAARAAAFEHRLAACILIDGVWEWYAALEAYFPQAYKLFRQGMVKKCNESLEAESHSSTSKRWIYEHLLWAANTSGYEALELAEKFHIRDIAHLIQCPTFVGEALDDQFFPGQPEKVVKAIGKDAYYFCPGKGTAATTHCHVGATFYMAQEIFAWLHDKQLQS